MGRSTLFVFSFVSFCSNFYFFLFWASGCALTALAHYAWSWVALWVIATGNSLNSASVSAAAGTGDAVPDGAPDGAKGLQVDSFFDAEG